ncbi:prepilin-type N-terminal cleavage/methylation domain-containing protein [Hyalangium rubrum]|uniref:Prepilin-type N-terminal cleavage/methylation domain-containing protein n=1 Tax=Hyalangium rubrum TaxID=3103134 RepID=A0ABU5H019_9BACT|nr:prepilin-type N-terminal cleavage/methylation domain-containing protein [Hyalangium sp. s54d21]MDY7225445.1 prepilin-type N-terminal cleavage/methylation domain-containing protein [Hyalangium sp. s54d21]
MKYTQRGFTLLETVIALAILALALMAIFDLNSGAVSNHVYSKHLTVASLLARSKMTDLEQQLYDDGFPADDDEEAGDFSEEGWPNFKWRAKIIAPKTDGVSPDQLIGAIFNLPIGDSGGDLGGLASMFGGGGADGASSGGPVPAGGGLGGMAAGMAQPMFTQMVEQLTQSVREVHLTVTWKQGTLVESMDVVTHVVSLGPGSDRNGGAAFNSAQGRQAAETANQWVDASGAVVPNPVPGPNGQMLHPQTRQPLTNRMEWLNRMNSGGGGAMQNPLGGGGAGGGIFNPRGKQDTR